MDDAVEEVFQTMLGQPCAAIEKDWGLRTDISARITLSGVLDALCVVEFPATSAETLTSAFLGSGKTGWDDAMIADAVGELCNMIAGGWKKRLGGPAWAAHLSTPSICRDCPHRSERSSQDDHVRVRRAYAFGQSSFAVCVMAL
jgi:chemotaxis protein CheX